MNYSLGNMLSRGGALNPDGLSLDLAFATDKTLTARKGPTPTFTRASTATFVGSDGLIQSAAINTPRFDHDPDTLACKGLLIEESRTNVLIQSDTLATQTITVTALAHTLSFYGTGTVVLSGAHIATVTGTGAYPTRTTLTFTPTAGNLILTVTGSVRQAQLEEGSSPTSYIPTTTAAAVRSADVCSITGSDFTELYSTTGLTFLCEVSTGLPVSNYGILSLTGIFDISDILIFSGLLLNSASANFNELTLSSPTRTANVFTKVAVSEDPIANNMSISLGGSDAVSMADSNAGFSFDNLLIGQGLFFAGPFNGHIKFMRYYKKALPNSKIKLLTAP